MDGALPPQVHQDAIDVPGPSRPWPDASGPDPQRLSVGPVILWSVPPVPNRPSRRPGPRVAPPPGSSTDSVPVRTARERFAHFAGEPDQPSPSTARLRRLGSRSGLPGPPQVAGPEDPGEDSCCRVAIRPESYKPGTRRAAADFRRMSSGRCGACRPVTATELVHRFRGLPSTVNTDLKRGLLEAPDDNRPRQ